MKFEMTFAERGLTFVIAGDVSADILNARRQLDGTILRNFLQEAPDMQDILRVCNLANLMKLKNLLMAYLSEQFPTYKVNRCSVNWDNGPDSLSLD